MCFPLCLPAPFLAILPNFTTPACSTNHGKHAQELNLQSHRYLIQYLGNMISLMIALVYSGKNKMVVIQSDLAVNTQQTDLLLMIRISVSPSEENSCLKAEPYKERSIRKAFYISSTWVSRSGSYRYEPYGLLTQQVLISLDCLRLVERTTGFGASQPHRSALVGGLSLRWRTFWGQEQPQSGWLEMETRTPALHTSASF